MSNVWEDVTLKGFKVFKWNEKLRQNNVDENKGLWVLRRSPEHLICRILPFYLGSMVQHPSDPDGYFQPRPKSHTFFWSLIKTGCFTWDVAVDLAQELCSLLKACFRFDALTINCPFSPRLVFVVDVSYTEVSRPRYYQPGYAPRFISFVVDEIELYSDDNGYCDDDDDEFIPEEDRTTADDFDQMEMSAIEDGFIPEEDRTTTDDLDKTEMSDVEDGYSEEMKDLVCELRKHCGNVARTYPLEPLNKEEPLGLVEAEKKLQIVVVEEEAVPAASPCSICLECLVAEQVAIKTKCGHLFHKKCSLSWFDSEFTCPMCRSNTRCII